ncbi:DUF6351 family protein [Gallaecimonas sp. GXIMD4217]|uniref:DUF6351 family protein n=1 Tax=Gallaecimonas sp. GXIMD4217 TaxID=3131927 RepID=UPI00311B3AB9
MANRGKGYWWPWLGSLSLLALAALPASRWAINELGEGLLPEPPAYLVQSLPPDYDPLKPRAPYQGPHPATRPLHSISPRLPVQPGEVGPMDPELLNYPFACGGLASGMGQPVVDNQEGTGTPVHGPDDRLLGHSKDCLMATRVDYFYKPQGQDNLLPLPATWPNDMTMLDDVPFVVRLERGTLNRYIYGIAMLADPKAPLADARYWNRRLIYQFKGGVGIGKRQGKLRMGDLGKRRLAQLAQGYAVIGSSGNITSTHYDLWRAARIASLVKAQFVARYGQPDYTVGIGGSGGAVQQYLLAEIAPDLLDALLPLYSYPDMITQSIWALDCELLEYYFDMVSDNPRWQRQEQRTLVEGMAASSRIDHRFRRYDDWSQWLSLKPSRLPPGSTECAASWRGLTPLTNNPTYFHKAYLFTPELARAQRFSYWHDLGHIYGVDQQGYAYRTYDNVGVQYGLAALREGKLTPAEFLHLNAHVGGWKAPGDMARERLWLLSGDDDLTRLSLWSDHNMQKVPGGPQPLKAFLDTDATSIRVAPRNRGHLPAMQAAYHGGQVFLGRVRVPIIDIRHYLDDELDMHHSFASLSTRTRLQRTLGSSDHQLIWVAEKPFDPVPKALALLDQWLRSGNRPEGAQDACWDKGGRLIAQGATVWNGAWNGQAQQGSCLKRFPAYRSPRDRAGAPLAGDLFKCVLTDVDDAIARGFYGQVDMAPYRKLLKKVFPDGVCDYGRGDLARPSWQAMGLAPP